MSDKTKIEWTDATWNPVTGCGKVSPGCDHCYAETIAHRFAGTKAYPDGFAVTLHPERLDQPLRWQRPRRVFVNSMSDLFHKDIPDEYIAKVFAVMALAGQHTFQVLTKRHGRMRSLLSSDAFLDLFGEAVYTTEHPRGEEVAEPVTQWPLPNVWLGVSVEDQQRADLRIPALLDTPAAVRFLSCEPLLGPVDLGLTETCDHRRRTCEDNGCWSALDWVIVGGESGHGARPMHPEWARSLRDQCEAAGVAFHFKQWGEYATHHREHDPWAWTDPAGWVNAKSGALVTGDEAEADGSIGSYTAVWRVGKKAAGRELDGRTWDEFPAVTQ
ncbi:phage Gp37/Gp68 family protein [Janibacter sp. LM]|uniref:DUF5131 family protein n=1 Tax=Janibacter sp. LM TaxID=3144845 RepID=UPI0031F65C06